ncbi:MAG TPA: hypothetical protein VIU64_21140 [Polyangia bacterium]
MARPRPETTRRAVPALFVALTMVSCGATGAGQDGGPSPGTGGATSSASGGRAASGGAPASGGVSGTGGASATGGATSSGGSGGSASGGSGSGGADAATGGTTSSSGGRPATGGTPGSGGVGGGGGGRSGAGGLSGRAGSSGGGGALGSGGASAIDLGAATKAFGSCRFHFGTVDSIAKNNSAMIQQLDFFTPGWMGQKDTFDMQYVCDYTKSGGTFASQIPVIVAYVAAFYAKRHNNLKDCNADGSQQDLWHAGAGFITDNLSKIVATYESYASGFAGCYGTTRPIIFLMEPDFYQYTISEQDRAWTPQTAGTIMSMFVAAIKKHLPNAVLSMDISPWVAPNDGQDNGKQWYANFDMTAFTFINTSGGSTQANSPKIRGDMMTWAGVSQVTGKPILADTGYGVNGTSAGPDAAWDTPANINARIADGVISISQYNPSSSWGSTISGIRSQLKMPCP